MKTTVDTSYSQVDRKVVAARRSRKTGIVKCCRRLLEEYIGSVEDEPISNSKMTEEESRLFAEKVVMAEVARFKEEQEILRFEQLCRETTDPPEEIEVD